MFSVCSLVSFFNLSLIFVRYAREAGCEWNEETCETAVISGNLDILKYLHENGCPWNGETCFVAAEQGYLDCLKYAVENGCPWDVEKCETRTKLIHCFECGTSHKCRQRDGDNSTLLRSHVACWKFINKWKSNNSNSGAK